MNHTWFSIVLVNVNKDRIILNFRYSTKDTFSFWRITLFFVHHYIYSKTSSTRAFILVFPPVGSARIFSQTKHFTTEADFPKTICSFLHFGQRILINFDVGSFVIFYSLTPRAVQDTARLSYSEGTERAL